MEYLGAQIFPRVDQPRLIKMLCYLDLVDLLNLSGGRLWQIRCEGVLHTFLDCGFFGSRLFGIASFCARGFLCIPAFLVARFCRHLAL